MLRARLGAVRTVRLGEMGSGAAPGQEESEKPDSSAIVQQMAVLLGFVHFAEVQRSAT